MKDCLIPGAPDSWTRDQQLALAWTALKHRPSLHSFFMADAFFGHIALSTSDPLLARIKLAWWREQGLESDKLDLHLSTEVNRPLHSIPESQSWLQANVAVWDQLIEQWPPDAHQIAAYAACRGALLAKAVNLVLSGDAAAMEQPLARWAARNLSRHTNTQSVRDMIDHHLTQVCVFEGRAAIPAPVRALARLANRTRSTRFPDIMTAARGALLDCVL
jgi:15-cis-phytoene synthase